MDKKRQDTFSEKQKLYITLLLAAIALVSISAATYAWFSIADFTKVYSMNMEITSGTNLRFDLDKHTSFEDYVKTLQFASIAGRIQAEKGFDMREVPLEPLTTQDGKTFTLEDGTTVAATSGAYLEFTLHFMATDDMYVHLTGADSSGGKDGTAITSSKDSLPEAMRISFEVDSKIYVYDPGADLKATKNGSMKVFGLKSGDQMVLSEDNTLFALKKDEDKAVLVRIWLEGSDPACTDALRKADYQIRLRFIGTDENNNILDGSDH